MFDRRIRTPSVADRHSHRLARRPQAGAGDPTSWWSRARPDPLRVRDRQLVGSPAARRAARAVGMPLIGQRSIALPTINTSSRDQEGVGWLGTTRAGSRAGRRPALGIRQAGGHEHGPILPVFVTASLSDPQPRSARREPSAAADSNSEFLSSSPPPCKGFPDKQPRKTRAPYLTPTSALRPIALGTCRSTENPASAIHVPISPTE